MKTSDTIDEQGRVLSLGVQKDAEAAAARLNEQILKTLAHGPLGLDGKLDSQLSEQVMITLLRMSNIYVIEFLKSINEAMDMIHTFEVLGMLGIDYKNMSWEDAKKVAERETKIAADKIGDVIERLKKQYFEQQQKRKHSQDST